MTDIIKSYKPPFPYTKDKNVLLGYLEEGNEDERIQAICYLNDNSKNYDLFWEIFLSDENRNVRGNALSAAISSRPDKIWEFLEYLIKTNERVHVYRNPDYYKNDGFIVQVAKRLNQLHKKNKI